MTRIAPFPGIRYNQAKISELSRIISPPYDKISHEERKQLWERDPHNVVRLILPPPGDENVDIMTQSTGAEDWYRDAADRLLNWLRTGILEVDSPRLYVYHQTYSYKGETLTRSGLFAALQLDDGAGPHAHEFTFEGPKADRLRLTRAARANLSPIFLLDDGPAEGWNSIFDAADRPIADFIDLDGQRHRLLAIEGDDAQRMAETFFAERELVIADGHHRYETACNYRREMMEKTGKDPASEAWGYVFALVVPLSSEGLRILPTHRVLKSLPIGGLGAIKERVTQYGSVTPIENADGETVRSLLASPDNEGAIILHTKVETSILKIKSNNEIESLISSHHSLRGLNVTLLHRFILEDCLGIPAEALAQNVRYVRGEEEAMALVDSGEGEAAFLMAGLPTEAVFDVSKQGMRMPQKSTDFYPKIPTGLIIRSAADSDTPLQ